MAIPLPRENAGVLAGLTKDALDASQRDQEFLSRSAQNEAALLQQANRARIAEASSIRRNIALMENREDRLAQNKIVNDLNNERLKVSQARELRIAQEALTGGTISAADFNALRQLTTERQDFIKAGQESNQAKVILGDDAAHIPDVDTSVTPFDEQISALKAKMGIGLQPRDPAPGGVAPDQTSTAIPQAIPLTEQVGRSGAGLPITRQDGLLLPSISDEDRRIGPESGLLPAGDVFDVSPTGALNDTQDIREAAIDNEADLDAAVTTRDAPPEPDQEAIAADANQFLAIPEIPANATSFTENPTTLSAKQANNQIISLERDKLVILENELDAVKPDFAKVIAAKRVREQQRVIEKFTNLNKLKTPAADPQKKIIDAPTRDLIAGVIAHFRVGKNRGSIDGSFSIIEGDPAITIRRALINIALARQFDELESIKKFIPKEDLRFFEKITKRDSPGTVDTEIEEELETGAEPETEPVIKPIVKPLFESDKVLGEVLQRTVK